MIGSAIDLGAAAEGLARAIGRQSIQGAALAAIALTATALWRRGPASAKCAIWGLVIVKLLTPTSLALPTGAVNGWARLTAAPVESVAPIPARVSAPNVQDKALVVAAAPMTTSATNRAKTSRQFNASSMLLAGWIAALAVFAAWAIARHRRMRRWLERSGSAPEGAMVETIGRIAREVGLPRAPRVLISESIDCPLVLGVVRPIVALPGSLMELLGAGERRALIAHELMHLKRRDHWTHAGALLAAWLHFFNPAAWLALRRLRVERERACDDRVLALPGICAEDYARALVRASERRGATRRARVMALALTEGGTETAKRVERILTGGRRGRATLSPAAWIALAALASIVLPGRAIERRTEYAGEGFRLQSERGVRVDESAGRARVERGGSFRDGRIELRAEAIDIDLRDRRVRASGRVALTLGGASVTAERVEYDIERGAARMEGAFTIEKAEGMEEALRWRPGGAEAIAVIPAGSTAYDAETETMTGAGAAELLVDRAAFAIDAGFVFDRRANEMLHAGAVTLSEAAERSATMRLRVLGPAEATREEEAPPERIETQLTDPTREIFKSIFGDFKLSALSVSLRSLSTGEVADVRLSGEVRVEGERATWIADEIFVDATVGHVVATGDPARILFSESVDGIEDDVIGEAGAIQFRVGSSRYVLEGSPKPRIFQSRTKPGWQMSEADRITIDRGDGATRIRLEGGVEMEVRTRPLPAPPGWVSLWMGTARTETAFSPRGVETPFSPMRRTETRFRPPPEEKEKE